MSRILVLTALAIYDAGEAFTEASLPGRFIAVSGLDMKNGAIDQEERNKMAMMIHEYGKASQEVVIPREDITTLDDGVIAIIPEKDFVIPPPATVMFFEPGDILALDNNMPHYARVIKFIEEQKLAVEQDAFVIVKEVKDKVHTELRSGTPKTDVRLQGVNAEVYLIVKELLNKFSAFPIFGVLSVGSIYQVLVFAEKIGLIELPADKKGIVKMAKRIDKELSNENS